MVIDRYQFVADTVAKFNRYLLVSGWFAHPDEWLVGVEVLGSEVLAQVTSAVVPHLTVTATDGEPRGFRVECLRADEAFADELTIRFTTNSGRQIEARLLDLSVERIAQEESAALYRAFQTVVRRMDHPTVIDVGGRDRSAFDREVHFPNCNYVVVDIVAGENVDIVGDAHALADHFPAESADAVISAYTFEHLLMPWKVVLEMNAVLKPGGLVCIATHQTTGLHDAPWDFWRFSADAWSGLFNAFTGFEIVETALAGPQFVIPFFYHHGKADAERAAGFEHSVVLARKTGPALLSWPAPLESILDTSYPGQNEAFAAQCE